MATTSLTAKDEFVNTTDGWVGVVELDHLGRAHGTSVEPGGSTFLSEEEQILTANAPRMDADNPFLNGALSLRTPAVEMRNRRPFGAAAAALTMENAATPVLPETATGQTPSPAEPAPQGTNAPAEEVATPQAAGRRRRT